MGTLEQVARNLKRFRTQAGMGQQALAERSGVSRRMLVGIESGEANVSLNTLDRLAEALGLKLKDLVQDDLAQDSGRIEAVVWQGEQPESQGTLLASYPAKSEVELWRWCLMPGDRYNAAPDPAGWREMFYVIEGAVVLELIGGEHTVRTGDFHVFSSDVGPYAYRNDGQTPARFVRNVLY